MMFGDVGQGIVLALFSTFMWKVKHNDLFHLMIPCGISSTIFGLVYGSLFGYEEALDPLYHALGMAGKPVSVMDSITGILMVAVYIGIVLVLAAMALNMYTHARHREWGEFIFSPNGLVGMVTYLCGVDLASAYMGAVTFMRRCWRWSAWSSVWCCCSLRSCWPRWSRASPGSLRAVWATT